MSRPADAHAAQVIEPDNNGLIGSTDTHGKVHPQSGDAGQVGEARGTASQVREAGLRLRRRASEELAFSPLQLEREGEVVPALPGVFRQQSSSRTGIGQRRGVRCRSFGAAGGNQVQLGEALALLARRDQHAAAVELADELEDVFLDRV